MANIIDTDPSSSSQRLPQDIGTIERHHERHNRSSTSDDLSVTSSYEDPSDNDLNLFQGAALITADCLGTGILALPADIKVLGTAFGLAFLIFNLPVNFYAGTILCQSAGFVEELQDEDDMEQDFETDEQPQPEHKGVELQEKLGEGIVRARNQKKNYSSITAPADNVAKQDEESHYHHHYETSTFDFIGMTHALCHVHPHATHLVMAIYYTNIFLVLGNYILVMSHAVAALVGEDQICLPTAGIVASTLMFATSQLRTMANLGRSASVISLSALAIVVIQTLIASHRNSMKQQDTRSSDVVVASSEEVTLLRQFSALASIGFGVGSQKLLLNIRHEFRYRSQAPSSLGISLSVFGTVYVGICFLAGPNPPSFLFDAIQPGWNRRLAGLLLWIHVAVSYAINSQAICSSMDRLFFHRVTTWDLYNLHKTRWMVLTLMLALSSYLVANAVPFFKDLVALIGALTSVPLTLLLPAVFYRKVCAVPVWKPTRDSLLSFALLLFALVFTFFGLFGALGSIELDWAGHGAPFACR